jgi:peptide/nickel transport system permease protein
MTEGIVSRAPAAAVESGQPGRRRVALRQLARNPSALIGGIVFGLIVLASILAPVLTPYDPIAQDTTHRLEPASASHLLGTDHFGRDIYTRLLYGSHSILVVAVVSIALALIVGVMLGAAAGYHRGLVEVAVMRAVDVLLSFPLILLAMIVVVVLGPGVTNLIIAIGISQVPLFARLAHSLTLSTCARDFVQAAECLGAPSYRVVLRHVLPNIAAPIFVQATTTMALAILNATALNFLGFGIQPPSPDWGAMVNDFKRFVFDQPILPFYPGAAIALTVLSLNLLGDGLIDLIDPTARKQVG